MTKVVFIEFERGFIMENTAKNYKLSDLDWNAGKCRGFIINI